MVEGKFDLNMEEVLESWEPSDAVREIIANALDEHVLSESKEPEIYKQDNTWYVRDFGRGLKYEHLTQSENQEKLNNPDKVIGKFGVGLKDSLATLHRHGVNVKINSPHGAFEVTESPKSGFEDISTLHVKVSEPEKDIEGTEVVLDGILDEDMKDAKSNFLKYADAKLVESTPYGEVYRDWNDSSCIYVTGLKVAEEDEFLYSYNISNTTKKIRDALNRERSNVGRTAYTPRVKKILKSCESSDVFRQLTENLQNLSDGNACEELSWKPVQLRAVKIMNAMDDVVFVTADERTQNTDIIEDAESEVGDTLTIPSNLRQKMKGEKDINGDKLKNLDAYKKERQDSFEFSFVNEEELTPEERDVWNLKSDIFELISKPDGYEVLVSEQIRPSSKTGATGLHQGSENRIIIRRDVLKDEKDFIGTLLHEVAHATSGHIDQTREFETELTDYLGELGYLATKN